MKFSSGHFSLGRIWCTGTFACLQLVLIARQRLKIKSIQSDAHTHLPEIWDESLKGLKQWLQKELMDSTLLLIIMVGLQDWYDGTTVGPLASLLYQAQTPIGWQYALDGWVAWQWQDHYEKCGQLVNHANQVVDGHLNGF